MNVLIACEESQRVCLEFRKLGHNAFSCDLQNCSGGFPEYHIRCDVLEIINYDWDLIIAHPPCTYLSKAGARWLYPNHHIDYDRYIKGLAAKEFFLKIFNNKCKHICIENPTPLKIFNLPECSQVIQPFEFGDPYSKRTLLWLKDLPLLKPTNILYEHRCYIPSNCSNFKAGKGGSYGAASKQIDRSKTFPGIAAAMAFQWGNII